MKIVSHSQVMDNMEEILQEACENSTRKKFVMGNINIFEGGVRKIRIMRECAHRDSVSC